MSVNPGFAGQSFIESVLPKIKAVRQRITQSGRDIRLEIDGGVKTSNIVDIARAGVDTFVMGSGIFNGTPYTETLRTIRGLLADI